MSFLDLNNTRLNKMDYKFRNYNLIKFRYISNQEFLTQSCVWTIRNMDLQFVFLFTLDPSACLPPPPSPTLSLLPQGRILLICSWAAWPLGIGQTECWIVMGNVTDCDCSHIREINRKPTQCLLTATSSSLTHTVSWSTSLNYNHFCLCSPLAVKGWNYMSISVGTVVSVSEDDAVLLLCVSMMLFVSA